MDEALLTKLREVKAQFPGARFIVFGSRTRGDARPDSDLDLYAVFPDTEEDPWELLYQVRRSIHQKTDLPLDVLICDETYYQERSRKRWTLEYTVNAEGIAV